MATHRLACAANDAGSLRISRSVRGGQNLVDQLPVLVVTAAVCTHRHAIAPSNSALIQNIDSQESAHAQLRAVRVYGTPPFKKIEYSLLRVQEDYVLFDWWLRPPISAFPRECSEQSEGNHIPDYPPSSSHDEYRKFQKYE
ncbi:hypothetical protein DFH09DRAFT_1077078 [Mycena vulgaris]|nr:hypothetical protein DFH09DRAFT_1077078 [Mycena vulgaris]